MSEEAKAVQEIAKTGDTALKVVRDAGGYLAKYFDGPSGEIAGIITDALKVYRFERKAKLLEKVDSVIKERGSRFKAGKIPLKLAVPLLEAGTMEDEDYLQELWAQMFVNGVDEDSGVEIHRSYIDILERISVLEARILETVYSVEIDHYLNTAIATGCLPEEGHLWYSINGNNKSFSEPSHEVKLALARLAQMGLLNLPTETAWAENFMYVMPTMLGRAFVATCSKGSGDACNTEGLANE